MNNCFLLAAVIVGLGLAGCSTAKPSLTDPGTAQQQQARANRFDPYPAPDSGLPSMAGTRPREYENPASEPMRADWNRWNPPCPTSGTAAATVPAAAYPTAPYPPSTGQYAPAVAGSQASPYASPAYSQTPQLVSPNGSAPAARYSPAAYSGSSQPIPDSATQSAIPYSGAVPASPAGR